MKKIDGKITIMCDGEREGVTIEIHDRRANIQVLTVALSSAKFVAALGRLAFVPCKLSVSKNLDGRVGKKHQTKEHIFEIPDLGYNWRKNKKIISQLADETCPEGWKADHYFGSRDSIFEKGGKHYAKTIIRRWV